MLTVAIGGGGFIAVIMVIVIIILYRKGKFSGKMWKNKMQVDLFFIFMLCHEKKSLEILLSFDILVWY